MAAAGHADSQWRPTGPLFHAMLLERVVPYSLAGFRYCGEEDEPGTANPTVSCLA